MLVSRIPKVAEFPVLVKERSPKVAVSTPVRTVTDEAMSFLDLRSVSRVLKAVLILVKDTEEKEYLYTFPWKSRMYLVAIEEEAMLEGENPEWSLVRNLGT
jgi:hypothetical protein